MEKVKKLAMLIDADNTSASQIGLIIQEVSKYGNITLKRAYGNWRKDTLKNWDSVLKHYAIKAIQQFDYVPGKNTTDIALVIDAMCLLYSGIYDGFAIASSDSDFTPLAIHLHEVGAFVIGIGEERTLEAFQRSCDVFIVLKKPTDKKPESQSERTPTCLEDKTVDIHKIHCLLKEAFQKNHNTSGYAYVSVAGSLLKASDSNFKSKDFGYPSLHDLIAAFPQQYEIKRSGTTYIYRCVEEKKRNTKLGKKTIAHRRAIMMYLENHASANRQEFEKLLSLQAGRTGEILHSLIEDGVIVTEGDRKNRVYKRSG